jgi:hypothetical protein
LFFICTLCCSYPLLLLLPPLLLCMVAVWYNVQAPADVPVWRQVLQLSKKKTKAGKRR